MSETRSATGGTITTDHDLIQRWAEERDGVPATVRGTERGDETGVLTIDFVGYGAGEEDLRHLDWDTWLQAFEDNDLAFLHQDQKADGETSTFFRLVDRDKHDVDQPGDGEHEGGSDPGGDSDASGKTTTDHDLIRRWAEERDGVPATVRGTERGDETGVLTIDFVGYGAGEEDLRHIEWDTWLQAFEDNNLAFLHQDQKADGDTSTFFRLVDRDKHDIDQPGGGDEHAPEAGAEADAVRPGEPTTDHQAIREWVEGRGGTPATMPSPDSPDADILTVDFVDAGGGNLRVTHVGWETWLQTFDDHGLAFVHEIGDADDDSSLVIRLVVRD